MQIENVNRIETRSELRDASYPEVWAYAQDAIWQGWLKIYADTETRADDVRFKLSDVVRILNNRPKGVLGAFMLCNEDEVRHVLENPQPESEDFFKTFKVEIDAEGNVTLRNKR